MKSDSRTQKEDKSYAEVAEEFQENFWMFLLRLLRNLRDLCVLIPHSPALS
ncbi:hypothetical protein M2165_000579 [Variovorax sp. TBS-050B]|nr:hypothetical protein [Variovorax sp. TBS-050B]